MAAAPPLVKRPRCPDDDTILVSLTFQERIEGTLVSGTAPWRYCRRCKRVFPRDDME